MVILNSTLEVPQIPKMGWGIVKREHRKSDFIGSMRCFVFVLLFAGLMFIPAIHHIQLPTAENADPIYLIGFIIAGLIISVIVTLYMLNGDFNEPRYEAMSETRRLATAWEDDILQPYLAEKYGLKFMTGTKLFSYGWTHAYYEGRSIQIRINGVQRDFDATFARDYGEMVYYYKQTEPEIWVEEVIQPDTVSFRTLPPKRNNM